MKEKIQETKEFTCLLEIAETLLGPGGCPWDHKQTLHSLQTYLLEETHELLEAIDEGENHKIVEEIGDLFYSLLFLSKIGEKDNLFNLSEALHLVGDKLKRRHPHVFGDVQALTPEEVMHNWEAIKKNEKGKEARQSILDGIPPTLPALARMQRVIQKMGRTHSSLSKVPKTASLNEEELGERLWELVKQAESAGMDAESACRRASLKYESLFRSQENAPERI